MESRLIALVLLAVHLSFAGAALAETDGEALVTVMQRDTLINICRLYLENPDQWRAIARLNGLKNPDRVHPGQSLRFPLQMLRGVPVAGIATLVKGEVSIAEGESDQWKAFHAGDHLLPGNRLKTGRDGYVDVFFENGTSFLLRSGSTVRVTAAKKGSHYDVRRLFLEAGEIVSRVKGMVGNGLRYEIRTPAAVTAARGTEFAVSVDAGGATRAEVWQGEVNVAAPSGAVALQAGEGTVVKSGERPGRPRKLLPPPQIGSTAGIYRKVPLRFQGTPMKGAVLYHAVLTADAEGRDIVREVMAPADGRVEFPSLPEGVYYLRVSSVDDVGLEGAFSPPQQLTVHLLNAPVTEAPSVEAQVSGADVVLRWSPVPDGVHYNLEVSREPDFRSVVIDERALPAPEYQMADAVPGRYYFRVRARGEDDKPGEWSQSQSFDVGRTKSGAAPPSPSGK